MHWDRWWHMGWMWGFWILVLVALIVLLQRALSGRSEGGAQRSPEQLLKARYARGEIEQSEYERRLQDLRR